MTKMVSLLTDFYEADSTYSLNIVAEAQLNMLLRGGYQPIGIVDEKFEPQRVWGEIELRRLPPPKERKNDVEFYDELQADVEATKAALDGVLEGVDVVITHDLIYQSATLPLNYAARWWAEAHPSVTWLNWVHSATPSPVWTTDDPRLAKLQRHFPNSKTVFPNAYDVPRVARNFRCEMDDVAVVPHPTDYCEYLGFQDITRRLIYEKDLLAADAILVYPIRLDRGKQVQYVIRTAAALKAIGRSARVIVCSFHSTGGDKVTYREELTRLAVDLGLNEAEYTDTAIWAPDELGMRCPREVIRDLMLLCNVFVMPSVSETYSLIAQEAALCGAFLVLNSDFPPMRSVYGPRAAYYQFSSAINVYTGMDGQTATEYDDVDDYFRCIALRVAYELDNNPVLAQNRRIRQERNPDHVFRKFIEPLFFWKEG